MAPGSKLQGNKMVGFAPKITRFPTLTGFYPA
jgi:hypothetical protein